MVTLKNLTTASSILRLLRIRLLAGRLNIFHLPPFSLKLSLIPLCSAQLTLTNHQSSSGDRPSLALRMWEKSDAGTLVEREAYPRSIF